MYLIRENNNNNNNNNLLCKFRSHSPEAAAKFWGIEISKLTEKGNRNMLSFQLML
jgi:hypothetical protein